MNVAPATTTRAETVGVSPKAAVATAVGALLGVLLAVANAVQARPELLGDLPPIVQFLILTSVPPAALALATYKAAVGRVALPPTVEGEYLGDR